MSISNGLTTKEVARLCRVSDATVKRWEESGLLKSERTCGGHRRFRAEEVARFQKTLGLGVKISPGDESVKSALTRRREKKGHSSSSLYHSLVAGREEEVSNLLIYELLHEKSLTQIFDELISPAMNRIGELWFTGDLTVAQEHLATRTAVSAIHKLRSAVPIVETTGELAMCCALEGDFHELPSFFAQMTLESQGWEVMNFGANTPFYSLAGEILHHSPELVIISSTILSDIERLAHDYKDFRSKVEKLKIPILLGGRGFSDERIRRRFPADFYPANFTEVAEFSSKLLGKN